MGDIGISLCAHPMPGLRHTELRSYNLLYQKVIVIPGGNDTGGSELNSLIPMVSINEFMLRIECRMGTCLSDPPALLAHK